MDELVLDFLTETRESLDLLDNDVLQLEKTPDDPDVISNIFRLMHTIKGTCGFLGLERLESVAHAGENILDKIRDGLLDVNPAIVSAILESVDQIKFLVDQLEELQEEPAGEDKALIAKLNTLAEGGDYAEPPQAANADTPAESEEGDAQDSDHLQRLFDETPSGVAGLEAAAKEAAQGGEDASPGATRKKNEAGGQDSDDLQRLFDETPCDLDLGAFHRMKDAGKQTPAAEQKTAATDEAKKKKETANQVIRVNLDVLEQLMQHASELVLTRNQLMQILRDEEGSAFSAALQRLNHITTELQEQVMKTRMQPIGSAWSKLPRLVRDLSQELGKKIDLVMEGEDTELDRQLLEQIRDPLIHMVRNSADHGIENPEIRRHTGKPETGTINLKAYQGGGYIIMEITDDGKGINPSVIRAKAVEKGLVSAQEAEGMNDEQIIQYIFAPGFSTAAAITSVSGRGVGMDVVKTNIEKISGSIHLKSEVGKGSVFTIKIPLTLAIMPILQVASHGNIFAIPQINVTEIVKSGGDSGLKVEYINGSPVLRLRNRLIPLIYLDETLKLRNPEEQAADVKKKAYIVVCSVGESHYGVIVDNVYDTEEIVVKPVAPLLRHMEIYSGCTILGNGRVIMILDPTGIARAAGSVNSAGEGLQEEIDEHGAVSDNEQTVSFVIFQAGDTTLKAVPLELLSRLESIDCTRIEISQGVPVVQYRGDWMKICRIDGSRDFPESGDIEMLVFNDQGKTIGIAVDKIVDIAQCPASGKMESDKDGFIGAVVVNEKTCDIIDLSFFFNQLFPHRDEKPASVKARLKRLLLAEDSAFFRKFIPRELEELGYNIDVAKNGEEALKYLRDESVNYAAIVTDIAMPGISGVELALAARDIPRYEHTPIIALSSCNTDTKASGFVLDKFDYFVSKTNHGELRYVLIKACDPKQETAAKPA